MFQTDHMDAEKKSGLLWMAILLFSICAVLLDYGGLTVVAEYGLVSILAIICWLRFSCGNEPKRFGLVSQYILSIVVFLLLTILRYASDYHTYLFERLHAFWVPGFAPDYTHWFLMFVCLPVSLLLIGGYFLARGKSLGVLFAWWGFFYFLAEAICHLSIELSAGHSYPHHGYLGSLGAMALFLLSAYGIMDLIKSDNRVVPDVNPAESTQRRINLWSILFISFAILYAITLFEQAGILPVGIIIGSMMGGMIGWRKTTARHPADPYKLVPLYLLLQALFYIHVGEETLTNFSQAIAGISGHPWNEKSFNFLIALVGPMIWIFAAWSLWKRQPFGNFILWFIIVGMILGEPTHILIFPVVRMVQQGVRYEYFSGMYTALFPMIPAILALGVILQDHRKSKISAR